MTQRILVVDDEPRMALAMENVLRRKGYAVDSAAEAAEALSLLSRREYAAVVSDLRMPGMDGHQLLRSIQNLRPSMPVIVVTAYGTVASAVACVRDGAVNYLLKPFPPEALERAVDEVVQNGPPAADGARSADFIAEDAATIASVELALRAAAVDATVLLEAESGAGKEVFARMIHRESPRRDGPFVAINCAALPKELLEAELFGHARGAFTGALRERRGHFQVADGGTLLLDEIGEMSADLQSRLLRVLQDHVIQPVGSETPTCIDVRVIAATHRNLREEVAAGRFREDLYYRLRVLPIAIPPLRKRPGDIEPLARRFARRFGGPRLRLTAGALDRLLVHSWPGNVRELENVIQRAAILTGGGPIDDVHLDLEPALRPRDTHDQGAISLDDAERNAIHLALVETGGNRTAAAAALGISPRTLRHKLKQYRDTGRTVMEPGR